MALNIVITENDVKSFKAAMEEEMLKAIKHFERELTKIRTGRAHTSLVDELLVACYGEAPMQLRKLAVIGTPDARLITVEPWDPSIIGDIQKALTTSDLGLSPVNDGKIIRIQLPEMSSTRRDELVKLLHKALNACKDAIKNVRKDFNNLIRDAKKDKTISEDFFNRLSDVLQDVTDKMTAQADSLSTKKEKDITTV
jgi:ribosome recycling factor